MCSYLERAMQDAYAEVNDQFLLYLCNQIINNVAPHYYNDTNEPGLGK